MAERDGTPVATPVKRRASKGSKAS